MGKVLARIRAIRATLAQPDASDWLMALGAAVLAGGIGMVYVPAGVIAAGVLLMACGWFLAAGSNGNAADS